MTATLTQDQRAALEKISDFVDLETGTAFLLEGGAGVGKTYLLGEILKQHDLGKIFGDSQSICCVAAPTHKAINVLRKKLDLFGVKWCQGFDAYSYNGTDVITGTTAALLGVRPVVTDEQTSERKFGKTNNGILSKVMPGLLIIDEVSMLGRHDFMHLREQLKRAGSKLVAVGDSGQLPPVKQEGVPFDKFKHTAPLRQIVRQAEGSNIVKLAWAIRDGTPWRNIEGNGVIRTEDLTGMFLDSLTAQSAGLQEEDRLVFIAYTNRVVNDVQERACRRLYGHGYQEFAIGELVLAETNLYRSKVLLCSNQDELIVDSFMESGRDPQLGVPVVLHHRAGVKGKFSAYYLTPEELRDPAHPYNVELEWRRSVAEGLQQKMVSTPNGFGKDEVNRKRRAAWASFFDWRDQRVISFRHPFAITSHKSQGSTYKSVYADTGDLGRFSAQALYVAVTRPREELVLARV